MTCGTRHCQSLKQPCATPYACAEKCRLHPLVSRSAAPAPVAKPKQRCNHDCEQGDTCPRRTANPGLGIWGYCAISAVAVVSAGILIYRFI